MAAYEVLLLNTAVPQIQAAQSGDTYVVPRDIAFSAVANLANGTYLLPALAFSSDPDTGIFRQGANQLGFTAGGGTDQMVLTSTGLGIGTSSPATKLDVNGLIRSAGDAANFLLLEKSANTGVYARWKRPNREYYLALDIDNNGGNDFSLYDATAAATRWTVDSSGNLGIGTSSPSYKLQLNSGSAVDIETGVSNSAGISRYGTRGSGNAFVGAFTAGKSLELWSAGAQNAVLDASGNLGIGTSSPVAKLDISNIGATQNGLRLTNFSGAAELASFTTDTSTGEIRIGGTNGAAGSYYPVFYAGGSERARITSGGYFKSSNNGTYQGSTGSYHEFTQTGSATTLYVRNSVASGPFGLELLFSAASPDDNTQWFLKASDSTTTRCYIWSDGDLANHDGVYGTISDQKLKQDIVDAGSQWDDLKAIRFRKYRMKSDVAANPDAPVLLGVIAQELEQVSPGLVDEHPDVDSEGNDLGTTTKTVKSSILLMKAAVALQEAMARIEHLEAKVSALESKGA